MGSLGFQYRRKREDRPGRENHHDAEIQITIFGLPGTNQYKNSRKRRHQNQ